MKPEQKCKLKIFRYDPSINRVAAFEEYTVSFEKGDRLLDVLLRVREDLEHDIAFRYSCKNRICGSCSVLVNGEPKLLCWDEALPEMVIEPLPNFRVIKDLVVDRSLYDKRIQNLKPYLEPKEPKSIDVEICPESLYILKPNEINKTVKFQECIECLSCVSKCPTTDGGKEKFPGPAALVRLAQYTFDPRDSLSRAEIAFNEHIFDCIKCYSCEKVCPINIPIVSGISGIEDKAKFSLNKEVKYLREMVDGYF